MHIMKRPFKISSQHTSILELMNDSSYVTECERYRWCIVMCCNVLCIVSDYTFGQVEKKP